MRSNSWKVLRGVLGAVMMLGAPALTACKAGPAADSGFLGSGGTYGKLSEQRDRFPFHKIWISDDFNDARYDTLRVTRVNTEYVKEAGWWAKANLKGKNMEEDLENLAGYARNEFQKKFREDKKRRFEVVDEARNDSLILELALVEVVPNKAALGALGLAATVVAAPLGAGIAAKETAKGAVAIEGRFKRADTGTVIAMFADREAGKFGPWNLRRATWYGHAHKVIQEWAQQWVRIYNAPPDEKIKDTARFTLKPW